MNVTNKSPNPLVLPGATEAIKPGATVKVDNWDDIKGNDAIKLFIKGGALETGGKVGEPAEPAAQDVSPAAQLAALNARQAAAGAPINAQV